MTITAFAPLLDRDGMALQRSYVSNMYGAMETRKRQWATPSHEVRSRQAAHIPVDIDHDHVEVGHVQHLERDRDGRLWCVASLKDIALPQYSLYFSPSLLFNRDGTDVELTSVAIVESTAQIGTSPITFLDGHLEYRGATERWPSSQLDRSRRPMLERAAGHHFRRGPILVHDQASGDVTRLSGSLMIDGHGEPVGALETRPASVAWAPRAGSGGEDGRPPGELEHGRGGRILSVR